MQDPATTVFRSCEHTDLPSMQSMVNELYATDIGESDIKSPDISLTFEEFEKRPDCGEIIVFDLSDLLVGYAILVFVWSNEFGGFFIEVDELFVSSAARGKGVGKAFFKWMETKQGDRKVVAWSLQVSPSNTDALRLYEKLGFKRSSSSYLKRLITLSVLFWLNSNFQPVWSSGDAKSEAAYRTGTTFMLKRKPKLALPHLSKAIQLDPANGDAYLERAHAHLMLEEARPAVEDASAAIRLVKHDAGRARGYSLRARGQLELSKFREAKDDFTMAIQSNRDPAYAWMLYEFRAKTYLLLDDEKSAYADLTKSINSSPKGNYGPYFHRGNILLKWKRYKEAIDDYTNSLKYRPADENVERIYTERARAYEGIGRKDLAAKDREKVRKSARDWEIYMEDPSPKQK